MEAEVKQIIKEKEYVHNDEKKEYASKGLAGTALGFGIGGAVLGAAALWGRRGGIGGGMPENVNINTVSDAIAGRSGSAPTAFGAYTHSCEAQLALTNEMWGLKMNTLNLMYQHRDTDVAEKFGLWKSQVDGDFGNYKVSRDLYDNMNDKLNTAAFGLYKGQRDLYDTLNERYAQKFCDIDKKVYGMEIANLYQNKIIQMGLEGILKESMCYTDRKTCRAIYGVVGLPSTPTVNVLEGANPFGCNCQRTAATAPTV